MEDYKRFFRYVIPGLVFIIEVSVYLLLSEFEKFICLIKDNLGNLKDGIGIAVTAFLLSGGIGYLLGVFYHTLFHMVRNKKSFWGYFIVDHLALIKDTVESTEFLELRNRENSVAISVDRLTQSGAWRIVTVFLNTRMESSERIKSAKHRLESYGDIMHGAGTMFISSVIAIPVWLLIHYNLSDNCPTWILLFSILISFIHLCNYANVVKDYQGVSNIIIANELQEEWSKNKNKNRNKPVIMHIAKEDILMVKAKTPIGWKIWRIFCKKS